MTTYYSSTEGRILKKLVTKAISRGWLLSIYDGEEWPVVRSAHISHLMESFSSTESDELHFYSGPRHVGMVWLIYGNEEDLISDHTDTPEMAEFLEGIF